MFSLRRFGIKLDLTIISRILENLDNPQDRFKSIHIAGTNGKGSIAAILAAILKHGGYRVGMFTSPHLIRFNERIQINGRPIRNHHLVNAYTAVTNAHRLDRDATFFEITTAMALYEFAREEVDLAVIETGLGGRLDATNVITPLISIISNISIEHRQYLGNTLAEIAFEKAGIIKKEVPLITAVRQPRAVALVKKRAKEQAAPCYRLGHEFRIRRAKNSTFNYYGLDATWRNLQTNLNGDKQPENAALAIATAELLTRKQMPVKEIDVRNGLENVHWPGRLDVVSEVPYIIIDGAHNLASARELARHLTSQLSHRSMTLIIGILEDKPYRSMLAALALYLIALWALLAVLAPLVDRLIITRASTGRAIAPELLTKAASEYNKTIIEKPTVAAALEFAIATFNNDAIVVAGSLYVVGEAMSYLNDEQTPDPGESG